MNYTKILGYAGMICGAGLAIEGTIEGLITGNCNYLNITIGCGSVSGSALLLNSSADKVDKGDSKFKDNSNTLENKL